MRTFILIASFIQNILGSNWKFKITSSLAIIVLSVMALKLSFPSVWEVWAWTWYFWFTITTLLIAILAFQMGRSLRGKILLVIALLPSLIFVPKKLLGSDLNRDPVTTSRDVVQTRSDTTYTEFNGGRLITHLEPYQQYRIDGLGPNEEVVISGTGENGLRLKQVQRTDSLGVPEIIPLLLTPGQQFKAGERIVFTHTKGYSRPILKRFF